MSKPNLNEWMLSPTSGDTTEWGGLEANLAGYFLASTMTAKDGATTALWTRSVPTALPKVDRVVLADDAGQTVADKLTGKYKRALIVVPWDALSAHLGNRLRAHGARFCVEPGDFPDEAVRLALGKPLRRTFSNDGDLYELLHRVRGRISADPAVDQKLRDFGEVPVVMMVDPTEEFDWQRLEEVALRIEVHDRAIVILVGEGGARVTYAAQRWGPLLPMN